jgi:hypothetical protein
LRARPEPTRTRQISGAQLLGRLLALPKNIRMGWKKLAGDKHSSSLLNLVNYGRKKFYEMGPGGESTHLRWSKYGDEKQFND